MNDAKTIRVADALIEGGADLVMGAMCAAGMYMVPRPRDVVEQTKVLVRKILAEPEPAAAKQEAPRKQFTVVFAKGQSYVEAWYVMATDSDDARQKVPVPANSPRPLVFPGHISPL